MPDSVVSIYLFWIYWVVQRLGLPLWSSGQSSCLQIQRSGFDSRRYNFFSEVVGLERGSLSLVSTIEELLERKSSGCGPEKREYDRRDPLRWPRDIFYPQKLALTLLASGGRSVGITRTRTEATEFVSFLLNGWRQLKKNSASCSEFVEHVGCLEERLINDGRK
jgi:hypothetical protein